VMGPLATRQHVEDFVQAFSAALQAAGYNPD